MSSQDNLLYQLRGLVGCSNLTSADFGELRWQTKQRVFLALLAELPEGKETVMACAELQLAHNRSRQVGKTSGALPEAARESEDYLRAAFFREVAQALTGMGAAPALKAPSKLQADRDVCLRAIGFLAARVGSHQQRQGSNDHSPELQPTSITRARRAPAAAGTSGVNTRLYHRRRRQSAPCVSASAGSAAAAQGAFAPATVRSSMGLDDERAAAVAGEGVTRSAGLAGSDTSRAGRQRRSADSVSLLSATTDTQDTPDKRREQHSSSASTARTEEPTAATSATGGQDFRSAMLGTSEDECDLGVLAPPATTIAATTTTTIHDDSVFVRKPAGRGGSLVGSGAEFADVRLRREISEGNRQTKAGRDSQVAGGSSTVTEETCLRHEGKAKTTKPHDGGGRDLRGNQDAERMTLGDVRGSASNNRHGDNFPSPAAAVEKNSRVSSETHIRSNPRALHATKTASEIRAGTPSAGPDGQAWDNSIIGACGYEDVPKAPDGPTTVKSVPSASPGSRTAISTGAGRQHQDRRASGVGLRSNGASGARGRNRITSRDTGKGIIPAQWMGLEEDQRRSYSRRRPRKSVEVARDTEGGGGDGNGCVDGGRVAVGLEMGTLEDGVFEGGVFSSARRRSGQRKGGSEDRCDAPSHADYEALRVENLRLRQRLEELQELVDTTVTATTTTTAPKCHEIPSTSSRRSVAAAQTTADNRRSTRGGAHPPNAIGGGAGAAAAAAASDAILRGQVTQLRRQVRLQWCAVDASAAVSQEVKAVLVRLEATLLEICSLGHCNESHGERAFRRDTFGDGNSFGASSKLAGATEGSRAAGIAPGGLRGKGGASSGVGGGVGGPAALPAWREVLGRVRKLSRELQWAERAAQRAADGRLHVVKESRPYLLPQGSSSSANRGQLRPRHLRVRALDPEHFTCPPPMHGAAHQQPPGVTPVEGYVSVISETPPSRALGMSQNDISNQRNGVLAAAAGRGEDGHDPTTAPRCPESISRTGRGSAVSEREFKVSKASQAAAAEAAAAAAELSFYPFSSSAAVSQQPGMHELYHLDAPSLEGFGHAASAAMRALEALLVTVGPDGRKESKGGPACRNVALPPPGVASLLLGACRSGSSTENNGGNGGNGGGAIVEAISHVRDRFSELVTAATALGVVVPCSTEGTGAASAYSNGPCMRLLQGIKPATGGDSARRLAALGWRLSTERAALEATAVASKEEVRSWRAAAIEQASAVLALGQGLRSAWDSHTRRTSSLSRSLTAILSALRQLSSPESTSILRGAAGAGAAALLQTLQLFEHELEDAAQGLTSHARRSEEEVCRLWEAFERVCWRDGDGDDERGPFERGKMQDGGKDGTSFEPGVMEDKSFGGAEIVFRGSSADGGNGGGSRGGPGSRIGEKCRALGGRVPARVRVPSKAGERGSGKGGEGGFGSKRPEWVD